MVGVHGRAGIERQVGVVPVYNGNRPVMRDSRVKFSMPAAPGAQAETL